MYPHVAAHGHRDIPARAGGQRPRLGAADVRHQAARGQGEVEVFICSYILNSIFDIVVKITCSMPQVVCPSANKMAVTLNSGFQMPSWFDLKSLDPSGPEDEAGVKAAAAYVNTLIEAEVAAGIPSERIVVGGFSQVTFYLFKKDFIIFKLQILCPLNYTEDN